MYVYSALFDYRTEIKPYLKNIVVDSFQSVQNW